MPAGYLLSEHAIQTIVNDHNLLRHQFDNLIRRLSGGNRTPIFLNEPRRQRFLNNSGEEVPEYAVMEVTAGVRGGANAYTEERLTITKPTSTFNRLYLVNGPLKVPVPVQSSGITGEGEGTWLMDDAAGRPVLYETGNTPAWGESWGAKSGQWTLAKNRPGFLVTGANNTTATLPYTSGVQYMVNYLKGKADGAIAKGSSGTVSIWMGAAGSEADTTINVTAWAWGTAITSGKIVSLQWLDSAFYVGCWES